MHNADKQLLPLTIRGVKMPTYAIGYDWVQYSGIITPGQFPQIQSEKYALNLKDYGTRNFNQLYEVVTLSKAGTEEVCAMIEAQPRVKFIASNVVLIKLDNKYCYNTDLQKFITDFNNEMGIQFKNFTRLDTFIDFQTIGNNIDPQNFLRACASRKIVVKGKSMRPFHERNMITGITWGSAASTVSFTMYNKSREMRKKVNKPWVNELWRLCGFDEVKDTYRLEFRHKKDVKSLVDAGTGEVCFSHTDTAILNHVKEYVTHLYNEHFYAAYYCEGVRISRMQRVYPLDMDASMLCAVRLSEKLKSNNYIKFHTKCVIVGGLIYQQMGEKIHASVMFDYAERLINIHDLKNWKSIKFPQVNIYEHHMTIFDIASSQLATTHLVKQASINLN